MTTQNQDRATDETTTVEWASTRAGTIKDFAGDWPHADTEAYIVARFEESPAAVLRAINEVAADVAAGKVRSGWAVLKSRLAAPAANPTVTLTHDREKAITRAERWIDNAGLIFDREAELVDELFGDRGMLKLYAHDELLVQRLVNYWRAKRPLGNKIEADADARAAIAVDARRRFLEGSRA